MSIGIDDQDTTSPGARASSRSDSVQSSDDIFSERGDTRIARQVPREAIFENLRNIEEMEGRLAEIEGYLENFEMELSRLQGGDTGEYDIAPYLTIRQETSATPWSSDFHQFRRRQITSADRLSTGGTSNDRIRNLKQNLLENPQAFIYALSFIIMFAAVFSSNPLLAIAGGLLLIITGLHYGPKLD